MKNQAVHQTHYIACNLCEAICGLEVVLEDGKIKSIKGDKQDPLSKGHICPKAVALQDIYNDPDRLRQPLKKTNTGWQTIPWKQAFDEVAEGLKKVQRQHGKDAVAIYLGNPTVHNLEAMLFGPMFFRTLGTRNRYSATSVDQLPEQLISLLMFGNPLLVPLPDLDRTDYHIIFGANPVVSNGSLMTAPGVTKRLQAIRERGGKLVVVDPRRTETAALADEHIFVKPGTDVLLLLAMLNVLFAENLQSLGKAETYTRGMEAIESLVKSYPPETVAALTDVDPERIRVVTREFCTAKSASCYGRIGVSTQEFGSLSQWLITVLNIVSGNLDRPGGTMFSKPALDVLARNPKRARSRKRGFADKHTRVRKLPNFNGEFPVAALAEEITTAGDGQIRALVTNAGNPVLSTPNGTRLDQALSELEFMVCVDIYLNETSRHADIILPPLCSLERSHYDLAFQTLTIRNGAKFSAPVFKAHKTQRSDTEIFLELAWRMRSVSMVGKLVGWIRKETFKRLGSEWIINKGLKRGPYYTTHSLDLKMLKQTPHGIDLGPLQPCLPERLFTPDKTVNLAPEECLREIERLESDLLRRQNSTAPKEFDLLLIGRRDPRTNNSWLHNSYRMVKGKPRCLALINPQDATSRDIRDGDLVWIGSRVGSVEIPAALTKDMMPGVISIPHGWGHNLDGTKLSIAQQHAGVNTNILTDDCHLDGLSGNAVLNGIPVSLTKPETDPNASTT